MFRKAEYLVALEAAILIKHKCKATHRETVFIHEETEGKETVWEGYVDVFDLIGHMDAKTCYAWQHTDDKGGIKIFAVLENQFIHSARRAVQTAIFMDAQPPLHQLSKEWELFKQQLEDFRKTLHEIGTKTEDPDDAPHTFKGIKENNRPRPSAEG